MGLWDFIKSCWHRKTPEQDDYDYEHFTYYVPEGSHGLKRYVLKNKEDYTVEQGKKRIYFDALIPDNFTRTYTTDNWIIVKTRKYLPNFIIKLNQLYSSAPIPYDSMYHFNFYSIKKKGWHPTSMAEVKDVLYKGEAKYAFSANDWEDPMMWYLSMYGINDFEWFDERKYGLHFAQHIWETFHEGTKEQWEDFKNRLGDEHFPDADPEDEIKARQVIAAVLSYIMEITDQKKLDVLVNDTVRKLVEKGFNARQVSFYGFNWLVYKAGEIYGIYRGFVLALDPGLASKLPAIGDGNETLGIGDGKNQTMPNLKPNMTDFINLFNATRTLRLTGAAKDPMIYRKDVKLNNQVDVFDNNKKFNNKEISFLETIFDTVEKTSQFITDDDRKLSPEEFNEFVNNNPYSLSAAIMAVIRYAVEEQEQKDYIKYGTELVKSAANIKELTELVASNKLEKEDLRKQLKSRVVELYNKERQYKKEKEEAYYRGYDEGRAKEAALNQAELFKLTGKISEEVKALEDESLKAQREFLEEFAQLWNDYQTELNMKVDLNKLRKIKDASAFNEAAIKLFKNVGADIENFALALNNKREGSIAIELIKANLENKKLNLERYKDNQQFSEIKDKLESVEGGIEKISTLVATRKHWFSKQKTISEEIQASNKQTEANLNKRFDALTKDLNKYIASQNQQQMKARLPSNNDNNNEELLRLTNEIKDLRQMMLEERNKPTPTPEPTQRPIIQTPSPTPIPTPPPRPITPGPTPLPRPIKPTIYDISPVGKINIGSQVAPFVKQKIDFEKDVSSYYYPTNYPHLRQISEQPQYEQPRFEEKFTYAYPGFGNAPMSSGSGGESMPPPPLIVYYPIKKRKIKKV